MDRSGRLAREKGRLRCVPVASKPHETLRYRESRISRLKNSFLASITTTAYSILLSFVSFFLSTQRRDPVAPRKETNPPSSLPNLRNTKKCIFINCVPWNLIARHGWKPGSNRRKRVEGAEWLSRVANFSNRAPYTIYIGSSSKDIEGYCRACYHKSVFYLWKLLVIYRYVVVCWTARACAPCV